MAVPTTLPQKTVNAVTFKPADANPQPASERKQTQTDSTALPAKTSNEKSVVSSSSTTKSDLTAVLLPVKVVQPPASAQLDVTIENQQYQLNKTAELQKLLQQTAQVVIASDQAKLVARAVSSVNLPVAQTEAINNQATSPAIPTASAGSTTTSPTQTVATQLVLLAQSIQLSLPQGLEQLAKQNGVSTQQLATLATRAQGYPLPTAVIDQGKLIFAGGTSIQLSPNTALNSGQYLAKVVVQHQQLQLALTPVIAELTVNLTKLTTTPQTGQSVQAANIIITKNEPAQILSQFLKKLESTPLPTIDNAVKGSDAQQKTSNELTSSSAKVVQDSTTVKNVALVTQQNSPSRLTTDSTLTKAGINMAQQANLDKSSTNAVEQTSLPSKLLTQQNTPIELTSSSAKPGQDSATVKNATPVTQQHSPSGPPPESNLAKPGSNMAQQANPTKSPTNAVEHASLPTNSLAEQNAPKTNTATAIDNGERNNPPINNPSINNQQI
ncbi:hypothetical protein H5202_13920, partial [Shewanella sp. SG41-4]|uniref:hypothetical protein n=1 Tax=Shewanella sp. SG41-4 TaxID=2760976 RepID=UPI0016036801